MGQDKSSKKPSQPSKGQPQKQDKRAPQTPSKKK